MRGGLTVGKVQLWLRWRMHPSNGKLMPSDEVCQDNLPLPPYPPNQIIESTSSAHPVILPKVSPQLPVLLGKSLPKNPKTSPLKEGTSSRYSLLTYPWKRKEGAASCEFSSEVCVCSSSHECESLQCETEGAMNNHRGR